ncbi:MAG: aldo/keto reductase [Chloroflexota bacterium]
MMEQRTLGRTEVRVTPIGLGGYPFGGINRAAGWDPFTAEGRKSAIATIHRAIERGINYVDTAPSYGNGNSEAIYGEALAQDGKRQQVTLATKCRWQGAGEDVIRSVERSLERLRTDVIDVIQFHGGMFAEADVRHILEDGPLEAFWALRQQGKARFLGFTCEEPWSARPLIASGQFDVAQLRYNLIYQGAALHALNEARDQRMGVAVMRPLTSGILQRALRFLKPEWPEQDVYALALKYVLADSRVHVANVGMRWPHEVEANVALASSFMPPQGFDVAGLPRMTAQVYRVADEEAAQGRDPLGALAEPVGEPVGEIADQRRAAPVLKIGSPLHDGEAGPKVTVLVVGYLSYDKYHPEWEQREACSTVTLVQVAGRQIVVDPGLDDTALLAGLAAVGVSPEEVDTVILTHTHGDHYRSVHLLPNAKLLASGPETVAWRSRGSPDKELLTRLTPTVTGIAPGVRLVLTPGHTAGSATVLVAQAGQLVAITGDAVDSRDFFARREPSHNAVDPAAEQRTFERLASIADVIVPGHGRPFRLEHGAPGEEL